MAMSLSQETCLRQERPFREKMVCEDDGKSTLMCSVDFYFYLKED